MKILDDLIYKAGGYSAEELKNASPTERRQIRQLGRAVLYSVFASAISWGIASTLLFPNQDSSLMVLSLFLVGLFTVPFAFSINRNLIFYSDTTAPDDARLSLPFFRLLLILVALVLCYQGMPNVNDTDAIKVVPFILAGLELYPMIMKKHMGRTITGRRTKAKLDHEHDRAELKNQQYKKDRDLEQRKLDEADDPVSDPDPDQPDPDNENDAQKKRHENVHHIR